jgi:hypothetical protein
VSFTRPTHPARVAVVVGAAVVVLNLALWGGKSQQNGPAAVQRPVSVVDVQPVEGTSALPQDSVSATVRTQFSAQLIIDNQLIPADEVTGNGLGQIVFEPGPGKTYRELPKGTNEAVVQWWPKAISTPEAAKAQNKLDSYRWTFKIG